MKKNLTLSFFAVVFCLFLFVSPRSVSAAGTLTAGGIGTNVTVGGTVSLPDLTFTDDASLATVSALQDLRIIIPSTVNAYWDTFVTMPLFTGTAVPGGGWKIANRVTYPDNKTMLIDVTSDFAAGDTLIIPGLSIFGDPSISSAAPLEFKTSSAGLNVSGNAGTNITVTAGALTFTSVSPGALTAGTSNTATINFVTHAVVPSSGKIVITFPTGFDLTGVVNGDGQCPTMIGALTTTVVGQVVTMVNTSFFDISVSSHMCSLAHIRNPAAGVTGTFRVETQTSAGSSGEIEQNLTVDGVTISLNAITGSTVTPASLIQSATGNVVAAFTTVGALPVDGKIVVTFPVGFGLGSVVSATCTGIDGSFTVSVASPVVTLSRSGGTVSAAGAKSCTIPNVINPSTLGATATFALKTTNTSDAIYDQQASISGVTIVAAPVADTGPIGGTVDHTPTGPVTNVVTTLGKDGKSVTFTWKNPTDADFSLVKIYRSKVSNILGEIVYGASGETFTDTGLITSSTYYYLLRPVDKVGNENLNAIEFVVIPGAYTSQLPTPATPSQTPTSTPEVVPPSPAVLPPGALEKPDPHSLVRGSSSEIYYIATSGKRYFFPSEMVFKTWYDSFADVHIVSDAVLAQFPLAGIVRVRPGTVLIKIMSDPKVYGVEPDGTLRWIQTEAIAATLFGKNWNTLVRDMDVSLFQGYAIGDIISVGVYPSGTLVRDGVGTLERVTKTVDGWRIRKFVNNGFADNRFRAVDLRDALISLPPSGNDISGLESDLAYPMP